MSNARFIHDASDEGHDTRQRTTLYDTHFRLQLGVYRGDLEYRSQSVVLCLDPATMEADFYRSLVDENAGFWPPTNPTKWEKLVGGAGGTTIIYNYDLHAEWDSTISYDSGQVVSYNGYMYVSTTGGNLNNPPDTNPGVWDVYPAPKLAQWDASYTYAPDDQVSYDGMVYTALTATTGNTPSSSPTQWAPIEDEDWFLAEWDSTKSYVVNKMVAYGGSIYKAIAPSTNRQPDVSPVYWEELQTESEASTTYLDITGTINPGNVIQTNASGVNWNYSGDPGDLGDGSDFTSDPKYKIYLNGVYLNKTTEVTQLSSTTFSLTDHVCDPGDEIIVIS